MLAMVDVIAGKQDGANMGEVAHGGHSCTMDASEVTAMATFLMEHGKVEKNGGWKRTIPGDLPKAQGRFRTRFLQDIISIINLLSESPIDADEIAVKLGIDKNVVKEYLLFLEKLTRDGKIIKKGTKYFIEKW